MVASNLLEDVLKLPPEDRMELFDRIAESLADDARFDGLTESQKRLLEARIQDMEANPDDESDWEDVKARAEQLLRSRA